ncbi:cupin domain-containing protein [Hypericibacter sp.]|uniref:cupin domain-containing protein n=1 Tax=Hypericibacter sp. TaxID=2705401 RepID=UPI003D6CDBB4
MTGVKHFKRGEMKFDDFGAKTGTGSIARIIGPDLSKTLGAGLAQFDGCSIEWTVLYDEMIVVLEGAFRLRVGKDVYDATAGDVIWIPENTPLRYEGEKSTVCYAVFPVDWRQRHGIK